jgi:hypothetical protein
MLVIEVDNVNKALAYGLEHLFHHGIEEPSRNGPVIVAPGPVCTVYRKPWQRVLFSPLRDANPFFHLMESLWMIEGRNDVAFVAQFAKQMAEYSDDGKTIRGAYGHRWRKWFGYDQLKIVANELIVDENSRRCVLNMWDAGYYAYPVSAEVKLGRDQLKQFDSEDQPLDRNGDFLAKTKDKPCNTHIYVDRRNNKLNITVCCRSNDIWWGAYGANAVHFSVLQEFLAGWIGIEVGEYRQLSNNFHIYTKMVPRAKFLEYGQDAERSDFYNRGSGMPRYPMVPMHEDDFHQWITDLPKFFDGDFAEIKSEFFRDVAIPMQRAWYTRKNKHGDGTVFVNQIQDLAWREACIAWIERREAKKQRKESVTA